MLARLAAVLCLLPLTAFADGPWSFEFEFGVNLAASRVMSHDCEKVVPLKHAGFYVDRVRNPHPDYPTDGLLWSCGGDAPLYNHWLGRKIGQPLPNLRLEVGWRHFSHYGDSTETSYDAIGVRGRFSWGRR